MNPAKLTESSHSEYKEGDTVSDMLKEDLIAERIAIESYRDMIRFFAEKDTTTKRMLEEILAKEEEHADDLSDLLFAQSEHGDPAQPLRQRRSRRPVESRPARHRSKAGRKASDEREALTNS